MVRGAVRGDFSGDACNIVAKIVTLPSQISEGLAERPSRPGSTHHKRSERTMPSKKRVTLRLQQKSFQTHHWGPVEILQERVPSQYWRGRTLCAAASDPARKTPKSRLLPL